ncbi:hypothetical protein HG530_013375 [Fusarium avenaceum]|nr:hypothetical protein HG530_013375 [Fusarium avenaceum]
MSKRQEYQSPLTTILMELLSVYHILALALLLLLIAPVFFFHGTLTVSLLGLALELIPVFTLILTIKFGILVIIITSIAAEIRAFVTGLRLFVELLLVHLESRFLIGLLAAIVIRVSLQEGPTTVSKELMSVCCDGLHDSWPVEVERTLGVGNIRRVEIVLDLIEELDRDCVDMMGDLNFLNGDNHEGRLDNLDEAVGGRLNEDIASEWHTVESKLTDRHVDLDTFVLTGLGNLLSKALEQSVQISSPTSFFLLCLKFILITVSVFSLAVTRLIKLDVCRFSVELNILCLLLVTNNDWIFEMNVNDDNQLMLAGLEEQVFNVGEQNVYSVLSVQSILEWLIILSSDTLTRRQEVNTQERPFTLVTLAGVLDSVDVERNGASHDRQHDCVVLDIDNNLEVLDLVGELIISLTFPLLLGSKLLLMLASLLLQVVVSDLGRAFRAKSCARDVLCSNGTNARVLLLLLRGGLGFFIILEEERVGISTCGRLRCEHYGLRGSNSNGVGQNKSIHLAVLVLRVRVLNILETSVDDKGHAVL